MTKTFRNAAGKEARFVILCCKKVGAGEGAHYEAYLDADYTETLKLADLADICANYDVVCQLSDTSGKMFLPIGFQGEMLGEDSSSYAPFAKPILETNDGTTTIYPSDNT